MNHCFLPWPKNENIDVFIDVFFLDELHPSLKFTIGKGKSSCKQNFDTSVEALIFLDVSIILHQNGQLETDIFCKDTNLHDYLNYFSHHAEQTKQNIRQNLFKRIIVFVSDDAKMQNII